MSLLISHFVNNNLYQSGLRFSQSLRANINFVFIKWNFILIFQFISAFILILFLQSFNKHLLSLCYRSWERIKRDKTCSLCSSFWQYNKRKNSERKKPLNWQKTFTSRLKKSQNDSQGYLSRTDSCKAFTFPRERNNERSLHLYLNNMLQSKWT